MMKILELRIPREEIRYPVKIKKGLLSFIGEECYQQGLINKTKKVFIVYDKALKAFNYPQKIRLSLTPWVKKNNIFSFSIASGENSKRMALVESLYKWLLEGYAGRDSLILSLGGGVVGDIVGFVAATFMRGINFVNIPTTLLAQVDSSIGGKVGVNLMKFKNIIGAFFQPKLVIIDPEVLLSLNWPNIKEGIAEVIKYGVIKDASLFEFMLNSINLLRNYNIETFEEIIYRSCKIKGEIVREDEREEKRIRELLNFGHTIGHAIEAVSNYRYSHGVAVSIGMLKEAEVAVSLNILEKLEYKRLAELLYKFKFPRELPRCVKDNLNLFFSALNIDKKRRNQTLYFVLPHKIGEARLHSVSLSSLKKIL